ncbi:uncharacterized protein LOC119688605 [Teleopsis dalmanni]|uniref:uncharacterized protein LOC119688605 n=1 Tax=Teleopsis dalmanni TaxID=139649 RepID=UPI0018CEDEAA|nr:uncharacterized protein LOC119688605 [Teleopsis dalmanni]
MAAHPVQMSAEISDSDSEWQLLEKQIDSGFLDSLLTEPISHAEIDNEMRKAMAECESKDMNECKRKRKVMCEKKANNKAKIKTPKNENYLNKSNTKSKLSDRNVKEQNKSNKKTYLYDPVADDDTPCCSKSLKQYGMHKVTAQVEDYMPEEPKKKPRKKKTNVPKPINSLEKLPKWLKHVAQEVYIDLKEDRGDIFHIFYESDMVIVLQEHALSFYKYKVEKGSYSFKMNGVSNNLQKVGSWVNLFTSYSSQNIGQKIGSFFSKCFCQNVQNFCTYIELRAKQMLHPSRPNLIEIYANIYYLSPGHEYVKQQQSLMDTFTSNIKDIRFTAIPGTCGLIMSWYDPNGLGYSKISKYNISKQQNVRDWKKLETVCFDHLLLELQYLSQDYIVGLGKTAVTIWNHTNFDIVYSCDLMMDVGTNLGAIHFSPTLVVIFQHITNEEKKPQVITIYLYLIENTFLIKKCLQLSWNDFGCVKNTTKTKNYIVLQGNTKKELWICCSNPNSVIFVPKIATERHFYKPEYDFVVRYKGQKISILTTADILRKLNICDYNRSNY